MSIDPIKAIAAINESYLNYLSTTFHLYDHKLREAFSRELRHPGRFVKGPILEATPPFVEGATLQNLIHKGTLAAGFKRLGSDVLPLDRPLYLHQERAVCKVVEEERNIVVATGTGSGKTEIFLLPILNFLLRQKEQNELDPGVRALLLYPMNALANDQLVRLRNLLKNYAHVTFGRYTGETEETEKAALSAYRKMFNRDPLSNELLSRERMRKAPPHILLTNYAMLEYLLLRPQDHVFFDAAHSVNWRFLVLDEAHSYPGARGIEIAMLLRRLKDRVIKSPSGKLLCIATSATLGGGVADHEKVADYATRLFGETFSGDDVISAARKQVWQAGESWGRPDPGLYLSWQQLLERDEGGSAAAQRLVERGKKAGIPGDVLRRGMEQAGLKTDLSLFLYEILKGDQNLVSLQKKLQERPRQLDEVAGELFPELAVMDKPKAAAVLAALAELAVRARPREDDQPLLPARYHVFVRAIEGAYYSLGPDREIFLARHEQVGDGAKKYRVAELATCRGCGVAYLVGELRAGDGGDYFVQQKGEKGSLSFFLLAEHDLLEELDEDEEVEGQLDLRQPSNLERYKLCAMCGRIDRYNALDFRCGCDQPLVRDAYLIPSRGGKVASCPVCGRFASRGLVRRFFVGTDAAASVLATSLYQQIKPVVPVSINAMEQPLQGADDWGGTLEPSGLTGSGTEEMGRKLLIFSDSRQDAAFFAPYFNRTYMQILRRNLVVRVLQERKRDVLENRWRLGDLVPPMQKKVESLGLFPEMSRQEQINEVWKWLIYELLGFDRRLSLEGLGLVGFSLVRPERWAPPRKLMQSPWNFDEEEIWTLFQVLLESFRLKGAVLFPDEVAPVDELFQPRNREMYFREHQATPPKGIFSWSSSGSGRMNGRLDYLVRLANKVNGDGSISVEDCREVLRRLWENALNLESPQSCWNDYFSASHLKGEGTVYRIDYRYWELKPAVISREVKWYRCSKCLELTLYNLRGVCPKYRCDGTLQVCDPGEELRENHYRRLYLEVLPLAARAEEHTAQLNSKAAASLQNDFVKGKVNILSCSTTFELGVDVGELEAVFLRNVPPSAANYVQRAGRAGRRTDSTAFTLTFAQRRSHDLNHFAEPWRMVAGKIGVPYFKMSNEKIVRRHLYAVVLAAFWKEYQACFGNVKDFFLEELPGPELLRDFIGRNPAHLKDALLRIVPTELHEPLQVGSWGWCDGLLDPDEGVLSRAYREVKGDIDQLEERWEQLNRERKDSGYILRLIKTLQRKPLLDYLSSRSVIPKYGFPVDVVELKLLHHGNEAQRLELERDLRIALSEYAPGSEVVAGGRLWTSRYIRRSPKVQGGGGWEWERFSYAICDYCQSYMSDRAELEKPMDRCESCGNPISGRQKGVFILPSYGFMAANEKPATPGEQRPERTYTTRIYYKGKKEERDRLELKLNGLVLVATPATRGKMAVINSAGGRQFRVCAWCGYAALGDGKETRNHDRPWGGECGGTLRRYALGHEFETDLLQLIFAGYQSGDTGFWYSLLYGLLDGCSEALDIDRQDLDGVLYNIDGDPGKPAIVLFDDVPGGAGHAHLIARRENLTAMLKATLARLQRCECGGKEGETSCYGCLRHYRNQFCHDLLNRRKVIEFLQWLLKGF